jgi:hypothetical protein
MRENSVHAQRIWNSEGYAHCPEWVQRICATECSMGADCLTLHSLGLSGDFVSLARKKRPMCGARNRQGKPCRVRVEPGKRRCRLHGGLSTGPKTVEGRQRIAEAQRRRWKAFRQAVSGQNDGYLHFYSDANELCCGIGTFGVLNKASAFGNCSR